MHPPGGNPHQGPGPAPPVSAHVEVPLHGATEGARVEFAKAVKDYADRLASESQAQEISNRPDGFMNPEVTATSVFRAKEALNRYGHRAKPSGNDKAALAGLPIFSGAAGVLGSYLNSGVQWGAFCAAVFLAVVCIAYLLHRRML